jgi:hypothetical protein
MRQIEEHFTWKETLLAELDLFKNGNMRRAFATAGLLRA